MGHDGREMREEEDLAAKRIGLRQQGELLELSEKCVRARGMFGILWRERGEGERGWQRKKGWEEEDPSRDFYTVSFGPCSITHRAGPGKGLMDVCLDVAKAFCFSFFEFSNQVSSVVSIQTHPCEDLFYLLGNFVSGTGAHDNKDNSWQDSSGVLFWFWAPHLKRVLGIAPQWVKNNL